MNFSVHVRDIEPIGDDAYHVTVKYVAAHMMPGPSNLPPGDSTVTLTATPAEVQLLDGLVGTEQQIEAWLDGAEWDSADLAAYLRWRIRNG